MSKALIKMYGCLAPVANGQSEGVLKKTSEAQKKICGCFAPVACGQPKGALKRDI
ncbi:MAG: hypothetical protein JJ964_03095 [Rhizobiales bacterium]|nr:hypothetical protein [Hyphomicrobiales bacterium]